MKEQFRFIPSAEKCIRIFAQCMSDNHALEFVGHMTDEDREAVHALVAIGKNPVSFLEAIAENRFQWRELLSRMNQIFLVDARKDWPFLTVNDVERITRSVVVIPVAAIVNRYKAELNIA